MRLPSAHVRYRLSVEREDGYVVLAEAELLLPGGPRRWAGRSIYSTSSTDWCSIS